MKHIAVYLFLLAFLFLSLQPYDKKYTDCSVLCEYYKDGKIIGVAKDWNQCRVFYGGNPKRLVVVIDGAYVIIDSICFK